ncbi:MAG: hypothetical protein NTY46_13570 [Candidatus Sumerlaeota bacterium]|nr:hypothetical protein [Candidatus Sumerlaeota bacterium]
MPADSKRKIMLNKAAEVVPRYELRVSVVNTRRWRLEVWQLPSPATPRLTTPEHIASLKGRPLEVIEHRLLKRLARAKVELGALSAGKHKSWPVDEYLALHLGLLFRTLAPMSKLDRIRATADAIEEMTREEAAYWLGMVLHRHYPRRVLAALRMLSDAG